jgi:hypothetical protein
MYEVRGSRILRFPDHSQPICHVIASLEIMTLPTSYLLLRALKTQKYSKREARKLNKKSSNAALRA